MAKFNIMSADGQTIRYSGTPKYHGSYMNVSYLEFSEICSPVPIDWEVTDYVLYTRTGLKYKLYYIPQAKKQARRGTYGASFVYQNVQLYAETKDLELAPFRDLVEGDNRIHFTTQTDVSTYEDVEGIARRIKACLDDQYPGKWYIEMMEISDPDIIERVSTPLEFSVSGVSCFEALNKIYELWGVGWTHSTGYVDGRSYNIITIGNGAERHISDTTNEFRYGLGLGLKSIRKSQANRDDFATRLYVYGGMKNMLTDYYKNKGIYHAENVVIDNLMIPTQYWGESYEGGQYLPDPALAYVENRDAMEKYGVIPKVIYLDGNDDYEDIYPTLRGVTIGMIRRALNYRDKWFPNFSEYPDDSERADEVKSAFPIGDNGYGGNGEGGRFTSETIITYGGMRDEQKDYIYTEGAEVFPLTLVNTGNERNLLPIFEHRNLSAIVRPDKTLVVTSGIKGEIRDNDNLLSKAKCELTLYSHREAGTFIGRAKEVKTWTVSKSGDRFIIELPEIAIEDSAGYEDMSLYLRIDMVPTIPAPRTVDDGSRHYCDMSLDRYDLVIGESYSRSRFVKIRIKQIGFDIKERQSLTSEGLATIAFIDGKCAGRSFYIADCKYIIDGDEWELTLHRGQDDSLGCWFPNDDYPIAAGDHFVLLDIAMPQLYIGIAENRLYDEALKLLADMSRIKPFYEPEIDAKKMYENLEEHPGDESYILREGKFMMIYDEDIIGNDPDYVIIDTLTINEGESNIPTYAVTLREEKKKSFTQSINNAITNAMSKVSGSTTSKVSSSSSDVVMGGGQDGKDGRDGKDGKDGAPGADGKSAYQIWMEYHPEEEIDEETWINWVNNKMIPAGGLAGRVLKKRSDDDYDVYWGLDNEGSGGGEGSIVHWGDSREDDCEELYVDGDGRLLATKTYVDEEIEKVEAEAGAHNLRELQDVVLPTDIPDGYVLTFRSATGRWEAGAMVNESIVASWGFTKNTGDVQRVCGQFPDSTGNVRLSLSHLTQDDNHQTITKRQAEEWDAKLDDAPKDGKGYLRKNGAWEPSSASGGSDVIWGQSHEENYARLSVDGDEKEVALLGHKHQEYVEKEQGAGLISDSDLDMLYDINESYASKEYVDTMMDDVLTQILNKLRLI